jgi:hypothetical protein
LFEFARVVQNLVLFPPHEVDHIDMLSMMTVLRRVLIFRCTRASDSLPSYSV